MAHPETGGVRTTEDESEKLETSSDDEEITIPSQDKAEVRNLDIRDEHSENTQREDWLLLTEPWHGARPRQTGAEHPPATKDSILKNAADIFRTLRLSPGRRVDTKEEVFTPPGGGGGRQVPDPRGAQSEAQAMSKTVPDDTVRLNSGKNQRKFKSPVEMLANTVAHMQRDLDILRDENHALRSTTAPQVIQAPRRAALTTTKVPRFDGTTSWEHYHQVFEAIVRSNGMGQWYSSIAIVFAYGRRCVKCRPLSTIGTTVVTSRIIGCINGPLWFSGSISGL